MGSDPHFRGLCDSPPKIVLSLRHTEGFRAHQQATYFQIFKLQYCVSHFVVLIMALFDPVQNPRSLQKKGTLTALTMRNNDLKIESFRKIHITLKVLFLILEGQGRRRRRKGRLSLEPGSVLRFLRRTETFIKWLLVYRDLPFIPFLTFHLVPLYLSPRSCPAPLVDAPLCLRRQFSS